MNKNSFAKRPPMGWNSYDYYDTTVNEEQVKKNADYMAAHLKKFGWEYIVVDIEWYAHKAGSMRDKFQYIPFSELEMDEYARLLPDPERFPSSVGGLGFKPLADYVHGLGLKFGIHIMRGIPRIAAHLHTPLKGIEATANEAANPSSICGWNPDMYGVLDNAAGQSYYDSLLELYAFWGVDFIKCDDICNTNIYPANPYSARREIEMLSHAIEKCGRPIVLSLSPGPALIDKAWHYEKHANMWRITDDFWDNWALLKDMFHRCELWQNHVSEGCWPDCDMLPLGKIGAGFGQERTTNFTFDEQRTMLTLWCIFRSPLMLGAELTKLDDRTLSLLTNQKLLDLMKPSCKGRQVALDDSRAIWVSTDTSDNTICAALFNLSDQTASVSVSVQELFDEAGTEPYAFSLEDLWDGGSCEGCQEVLEKELPPHGCVIWKLHA